MVVLAHLTDPHLGPLPAMRGRDFASKRLLGYLNWRRNRAHAFHGDILAALIEDMRAHKPDHVAVTGDLVNLALGAELAAAHDWLTALGAPAEVTVIPGNHDAYMRGSLEEASRLWRRFMASDEDKDDTPSFPFVRRRGPIALVGLSTAVPTAPFMATGRVTAMQANRLGEHLVDLGKEGLFRIVLVHHAPVDGSSAWQRRLVDARLIRDQIARAGAELVLHGHNHRAQIGYIAGAKGNVPVIGGAAASAAPRRGRPGGSYNLFKIEARDGGFACTMTERGVAAPGGKVETLSERTLAGGA